MKIEDLIQPFDKSPLEAQLERITSQRSKLESVLTAIRGKRAAAAAKAPKRDGKAGADGKHKGAGTVLEGF